MYIQKIRAEWFRNYKHLVLEPHSKLNIITGLNAQGKTNLLESIYFNINGKSFRTKNLKEMINWQSDYCSVINIINKNGRQWKQSVAYNNNGTKKITINGLEKKNKDFNRSGVIVFTPDDLTLIKNSPSERRKFLDQEVGSFYTSYSKVYQNFSKVLSHRNQLLKSSYKKLDNVMLDTWDDQLVTSGINVLMGRLSILKKLAPLAIKWYNLITDGYERLEIRYLSSLEIEPAYDEKILINKFYQVLKNVRNDEIKRKQTLVGPHRDDVIFFINGRDARNYGSQGQQRTLVLSLKLALISLWSKEYQTDPILLLDDVLFELDHKRQKFLLSEVNKGIQTFVTTNHLNTDNLLHNDFKLFTAKNGQIKNTNNI
ncbi:MAG: DNA replication/repair protein RecF [Firmicutes bacterium]|nr:DNA replication/repair protein RecF [Bacillota bacterium]